MSLIPKLMYFPKGGSSPPQSEMALISKAQTCPESLCSLNADSENLLFFLLVQAKSSDFGQGQGSMTNLRLCLGMWGSLGSSLRLSDTISCL